MARRKGQATGWDLRVKNLATNEESTQSFDKVVICTGAFNRAKLPPSLQDTSRFKGPVVHTSELGSRHQEILDAVPPKTSVDDDAQAQVVVVGGGKSAADSAAWFAAQGRRVTVVMSESMWHIPIPGRRPPDFLRRSR
jgi:cation diffusion facilitator CzcD-associated flavoprotein CzcO